MSGTDAVVCPPTPADERAPGKHFPGITALAPEPVVVEVYEWTPDSRDHNDLVFCPVLGDGPVCGTAEDCYAGR